MPSRAGITWNRLHCPCGKEFLVHDGETIPRHKVLGRYEDGPNWCEETCACGTQLQLCSTCRDAHCPRCDPGGCDE